jgi:hypothetical protein
VINEEINKLYQPTLDRISEVKNCKHYWVRNMARHTTDVQIVDTSQMVQKNRLITIQKFGIKVLVLMI